MTTWRKGAAPAAALMAIALGLSNGEISQALHLSPATVKTHINRIFAKLAVRDRVQAVILAHQLGLTIGGQAN